MKKLLATGLIVTAMLLGCQDPIAAKMDELPPQQVSLDNDYLRNTLRFRTPMIERVGAGQLKVTMQVYNLTGDPVKLDYKYYFTDANWTPIDDGVVTGWLPVQGNVAPHDWTAFSFTSISAAPQNFKVHIRQGQ